MAIGLAILLISGVIHFSTRQYNKRVAKKNGFDSLDHDHLWRPLDGKRGKKLSKNEAKALAKFRQGETMENMTIVQESKVEDNIRVPYLLDDEFERRISKSNR